MTHLDALGLGLATLAKCLLVGSGSLEGSVELLLLVLGLSLQEKDRTRQYMRLA